jgi:prophage maintenance system killer protein
MKKRDHHLKDNVLENITTLYQAENGAIAFRNDLEHETIWANQKQIAQLFDIDRSVVNRHINNIFSDKELDQAVVCAQFAHTTQHGAIQGKSQTKQVNHYSLDIILAVGYRTNSRRAIVFRKWATTTLKEHLLQGYTINKNRVTQNYESFLQAVAEIKNLLITNSVVGSEEVLELISVFAGTWFALDAYDTSTLPVNGFSEIDVTVQVEELISGLDALKQELINKEQATVLFAQEKKKGNLGGILGNVFQSAFGEDVYSSFESKAAHLLYFIIKNHPFNDGNKRSAAFCFVWLLNKAGILRKSITPEALAALTLLIAESNPLEKDKMVGLVILLINGKYK